MVAGSDAEVTKLCNAVRADQLKMALRPLMNKYVSTVFYCRLFSGGFHAFWKFIEYASKSGNFKVWKLLE